MKIIFIFLLCLLAGCSNTPDAEQQAADDAAYSSDYTKYAENSKVAKINLDDQGKVSSIEIGNQNLQSPQRKAYQDGFAQTLVKETFQTVRAGIGAATSPHVALAATGVLIAKELGNSAGHNVTNNNSYNQHSEANQANSHSEANQANSTVTTTTTNADSYNTTAESHNQQNPVTSTDNTNNSVNSSNNQQTTTQPVEAEEEGGN